MLKNDNLMGQVYQAKNPSAYTSGSGDLIAYLFVGTVPDHVLGDHIRI
jgi:hypothetical protein